MTMPNFYIAGGARCGSTSVDAYCRAHPQIFMSSVKEPNYFSYGYGEVPYAGPGRDKFYNTSTRDLASYQALFRDADDAMAIGEASINYMLHPAACAGIRALTPDAKIIFILRQPVERAWSSFQLARQSGLEPLSNFLDAWEDDARRRAAGHWSCIHRHKSLYGQHLKCWFDTFPSERIRVILFDDLRADAAAVMRQLFTFLEVDPDFRPDTSVVHNRSGEIENPLLRTFWHRSSALRAALVPLMPIHWRGRLFRYIASGTNARKPGTTLPPEIKTRLTAELRGDILALEQLIGRDLSCWYE